MNYLSVFKRTLYATNGFILYTTLVVLGISFFIVVGVSAIFLREIHIADETGNSAVAFLAAESGMERALYEVRKGSTFSACRDANDCTIGTLQNKESLSNGAEYYVTVIEPGYLRWCQSDPDVQYCIRSVGIYRTSSRALETTL
ncbi:MAG: hypothetical protein F4X82_00105 [Candidatus Spechtbacteria bacterium SB0662_bin_43]|uniref:Type 4 fimbrial biogenesis protein PilX N-terminal domain-containing protein n=1 Tax=Candidatus Spechtbacteria bacterium SB0662_bin_43 TaxID=2604897 RepID=A0A845D961_9BACT|nr:hypothetical protein [Candidatus Spechtbacteria bacterium SB0662_bin_43]